MLSAGTDMHGMGASDPGRTIDWGHTSADYARYRPGPPPRLYSMLQTLGIGLKDQRILDLGTGTGVLAHQFARQGARVAGIDISDGQIRAARKLASDDGLDVDFITSGAEQIPFPDGSMEVVTANQCWLYFDPVKTIPEIKRVLVPGGCLVTSHFSWLPRLDPVARATEELVLKHNPAWTAADYKGIIPGRPDGIGDEFDVTGMFYFDEDIVFTHESWRGRIRACRGVGATLSSDEVIAFDAELAGLLSRIAPAEFTVRHRIDAHVMNVICNPKEGP